jgi:hypothetical protein
LRVCKNAIRGGHLDCTPHISPGGQGVVVPQPVLRPHRCLPRRYETRDGRAGYSPVCANEWALGVCGKPKTKCQSCPSRKLLPVTDEVIRRHLSGYDERGRSFTAGVYPMLLGETCLFLAVDSRSAPCQHGRGRGDAMADAAVEDVEKSFPVGPASEAVESCRVGPIVFREGNPGAASPQRPCPPGGVPQPRVSSRPSHASFHLRYSPDHFVRRGISQTYRPVARVHARGAGIAQRGEGKTRRRRRALRQRAD